MAATGGLVEPPARLPLGETYDPVGKAACADLVALARASGGLVAAKRSSPVVVPLTPGSHPVKWESGLENGPVPDGPGSLTVQATVERPGRYEVWLEGSVRPRVEAFVDGEPVGRVRHELNNQGQYVSFGSVALEPGVHRVEIRFAGRDLHPGSGGRGVPVGPIALSDAGAAGATLTEVAAADVRSELCGRRWDWIEGAC